METTKTTIGQVIVSMLTLLWIYAAISKLGNLHETILQMQKQPLPMWSATVLAIGIPIVELGIAGLLNVRKTRRWALLGSTGLLCLFSLYLLYVLQLDKSHIPCSCGGVLQQLGWEQHLWFNLFWLAVCMVGIRLHWKLEKGGDLKTNNMDFVST